MALEDDLLQCVYGLPHLQWEDLDRRIDALPSKDRDNACFHAIRRWLQHLAKAIGLSSVLSEAEGALLLATSVKDQGPRLLEWSIAAVKRIQSIVGNHFTDEMYGPMVILIFDNHDQYYSYILRYHDDGEYMASGGMLITPEYCHTVVGPGDFGTRQTVLAHELTHYVVAPLPLPVWLNEGLAMLMEQRLLGNATFHLDRELAERHRAHWTRESIQEFWSGDHFVHPDERSELSYHLAEVLVQSILLDRPRDFIKFVGKARWSDAGAAASREVFGCRIDQYVEMFLGEGEWQPDVTPDRTGAY